MRKGLWLLVVAGLSCLVGEKVSFAQGLIRDYVVNVPRQYGPRDPWDVGLVLRNQVGWGGHFYNCDCEEHKRLSPYIRWEQQPTVCCPHGHCWDIKQQINEVKQRVRTGSCRQTEFCLCPHCSSSEPPIRSSCPDAYGAGGCPTCGGAVKPASAIDRTTRVEEAPSESPGWLGQLYQSR